ncbi:MAG TPA: hypothetical protein VHI77_09135, partial [Solirubrobacterales bacterium]|nr:hypothetical protein [Solirubrobacterales bacterium]
MTATAFAAAAIAVGAAALAPAGAAATSRIVYAHDGRLLAISPSGGRPHRIGTVPRGTLDLSASRNGRRIALIANRKLPYPNRGSVRTIYLWRAGH